MKAGGARGMKSKDTSSKNKIMGAVNVLKGLIGINRSNFRKDTKRKAYGAFGLCICATDISGFFFKFIFANLIIHRTHNVFIKPSLH